MEIILIVGGTVVLIALGVLVLGLALRAMRPKVPEPQVYSVPQTTAMPIVPAAPAAPPLSPAATAEIDRLIATGDRIRAIKLLRDQTGVSLQEAKNSIDRWVVGDYAPHSSQNSSAGDASAPAAPSGPATPSSVRSTLPASVTAEIDRLVASEQPILAIKTVREHTGLGLKDSKDIVEAWPRPDGA